MFNFILGLVIAGIGVYNITTYTGDMTLLWNIKYYGLVLGGGGVALWELIPTVYTYLSTKLPSLPAKPKENKVKELSAEISIKDEVEQDTQCLFYLAERLKGTPEGLDLCAKLNVLLFTLHHPAK